ncbi:hypothetical protein [Candidatus Pelagibacter sp. HIMB1695]|uniref:hypothetical protein n=1 Tax=Candidatus Pelagibacter sp. HIMB1695 TaxID=3413364 RepID=UPI003F857B32
MNEKLENFKNRILSFLLKIFSPILGKQAISKENRFAIELDDEGISICKYNQGSKTITNLHHEKFNLAGNTSLFNEDDQVYYSQKIVHILKDQKLLEKEATVILPTSETIIKTINIPLMDQETFDLQTSDIEFWKTFEELSDIIDNKIFSFQPLAINDETQEQEVVICLIEREKVEKLNKILRQSGVKPTIYEPKCFSLINTIFAKQKDNKSNEFAFLEYGEKENYLITVTQNKFIFAINNITRADIILIKQLEKMPDPSGPFWSEVFERSIQDVRGNLMDDEWKGSEEKTTIFRNLYVHTDLEQSEKYLNGLQSKLPDFTIKPLTLNNAKSDESKFENILTNKKIKFSKKLIKKFNQEYILEDKLYPVIGASLRLFNPFNIKENLFLRFKQNLYPYKDQLINNRKIQATSGSLSIVLILLLLIFSSIIGLNIPKYLEKNQLLASHPAVVNDYNSLMEEIKTSSSKVKKIEKEKELAEKLIVKTDNFSKIIIETPKIVPNGVELQKVDYIKNDSVVFYEGYALTDYDLNLFLNNIKKRVGNPDITSLSLAELTETIEINNEGDEEDQQIIVPSEDVLKLRNFKIKVEL